jgi:hypothetical protein
VVVSGLVVGREAVREGGAPYRSITEMIGETRIEAVPAAEASAVRRRPKLEEFHALSCAVD